MARVSYVPYDESYVLLFQFCHVDVPEVISYTDTIKGWDPTAFAYAIDAATVYLDDNMDACYWLSNKLCCQKTRS